MRRTVAIGALLAAAGSGLIGSSAGASSLLVHYPPLECQAMRFVLSALACALMVRVRGQSLPRLNAREGGLVLALALTGMVGFNLCLLAALHTASPAAVGVIVGCVPVVLALIGPLLAGRAPRCRALIAAATVSAGAAVVQGAGHATLLGLLCALGALAGESAFSLLAVPLLPKLGPLALSTYLCATAGLVLAVAAMLVDGTRAPPALTLAQAVAICYLALAVTTIGVLAWYAGLGRLGVERAGLFAGLIPIGALLGGVAAGTGILTLPSVLGSAVVGAGVAFGQAGGGGKPA